MNVQWSRKAYDDLAGLAHYLAPLSAQAAERIIDRIQRAIVLLGENPKMGAKVDETGLRKLLVPGTRCILFYRIFPDHLDIRGLFHTSQRRFLE